MDFIISGLQGSGKGEQAARLAEEFEGDVFDMGATLRELAEQDSDLGRRIHAHLERGDLVPLALLQEIVTQRIGDQPPDRPLFFDGFPRTSEQMAVLQGLLENADRNCHLIHLVVSEDTAHKRIKSRAMAEGRTDDQDESVVQARMRVFDEETLPMIVAHCEGGGAVTEIDGEGSIDEVYGTTSRAVREILTAEAADMTAVDEQDAGGS